MRQTSLFGPEPEIRPPAPPPPPAPRPQRPVQLALMPDPHTSTPYAGQLATVTLDGAAVAVSGVPEVPVMPVVTCDDCGRPLSDPVSRAVRKGPICEAKAHAAQAAFLHPAEQLPIEI